jgi:hypothetical protein
MARLEPGDVFPTITVAPVDRGPREVPGDLVGHFVVVLFYRG